MIGLSLGAFIELCLLSLLLIVGGILWISETRSRGEEGMKYLPFARATVALGVLVNPITVRASIDYGSFHAVLVVVGLFIGLAVLGRKLFRATDSVRQMPFGEFALKWVWVAAVVQDVFVWITFQGFSMRLFQIQPLLLALSVVLQSALGLVVLIAVSGEAAGRLNAIRQVFLGWTSAMAFMTLGMAIGLSGGTWWSFLAHAGAIMSVPTDQQIAAAVLVILGGAPWFIVGALRLGYFIDYEGESFAVKGRRMGRSVRINPPREG